MTADLSIAGTPTSWPVEALMMMMMIMVMSPFLSQGGLESYDSGGVGVGGMEEGGEGALD